MAARSGTIATAPSSRSLTAPRALRRRERVIYTMPDGGPVDFYHDANRENNYGIGDDVDGRERFVMALSGEAAGDGGDEEAPRGAAAVGAKRRHPDLAAATAAANSTAPAAEPETEAGVDASDY